MTMVFVFLVLLLRFAACRSKVMAQDMQGDGPQQQEQLPQQQQVSLSPSGVLPLFTTSAMPTATTALRRRAEHAKNNPPMSSRCQVWNIKDVESQIHHTESGRWTEGTRARPPPPPQSSSDNGGDIRVAADNQNTNSNDMDKTDKQPTFRLIRNRKWATAISYLAMIGVFFLIFFCKLWDVVEGLVCCVFCCRCPWLWACLGRNGSTQSGGNNSSNNGDHDDADTTNSPPSWLPPLHENDDSDDSEALSTSHGAGQTSRRSNGANDIATVANSTIMDDDKKYATTNEYV